MPGQHGSHVHRPGNGLCKRAIRHCAAVAGQMASVKRPPPVGAGPLSWWADHQEPPVKSSMLGSVKAFLGGGG